jgi:hypothetical protein
VAIREEGEREGDMKMLRNTENIVASTISNACIQYYVKSPARDAQGAKRPRGEKLPSPPQIRIARDEANAETGAARSRIVRDRGTEQQSPFGIDTPERSPDCEASPGAATRMSRRPERGCRARTGTERL